MTFGRSGFAGGGGGGGSGIGSWSHVTTGGGGAMPWTPMVFNRRAPAAAGSGLRTLPAASSPAATSAAAAPAPTTLQASPQVPPIGSGGGKVSRILVIRNAPAGMPLEAIVPGAVLGNGAAGAPLENAAVSDPLAARGGTAASYGGNFQTNFNKNP